MDRNGRVMDRGSEEKNDGGMGGKRNKGMSGASEERGMTGNSWREFARKTDTERGMMRGCGLEDKWREREKGQRN